MDETVYDERFEGEESEEQEGLRQFLQETETPFPTPLGDPLAQLVTLGHLEDSFDFGGNAVVMRTLRAGEELKAMRLLKEFEGVPLAEGRAFAAAMVSASIASINGMPLVIQLGPDFEGIEKRRFEKVLVWHYPLIEMLYRRYARLERKQAEVLAALRASLEPQDEDSDAQATDQNVE
jgi:hypothetical protein